MIGISAGLRLTLGWDATEKVTTPRRTAAPEFPHVRMSPDETRKDARR